MEEFGDFAVSQDREEVAGDVEAAVDDVVGVGWHGFLFTLASVGDIFFFVLGGFIGSVVVHGWFLFKK
ncbi:MAG: hypothetical protein JXK07_16210 [Spirochaetes bacterium]|nr:hypothetical protein [Spirochaetota bacterium]MBN2772073.1 hypothetical protein [Spirochaetota bacterium]